MPLKEVLFKKVRPEAKLPTWAYEAAAGADVYACLEEDSITVMPHMTVSVPLGIRSAFAPGYAAMLYARGGTAMKKGIAPANKVGVVDADYRGEWQFPAHNHSEKPMVIENGERIGQVIFHKVEHPIFTEVDDEKILGETQRGEGRYNSSGTK